ncbi:TetR/AcrR family transcriptional regulator [filamentous cyanobacterium LEGE 11480]|uniref:TetR/AcrR family transcriptional regulator n=1 Tax=Romeriopsis navalis LEGE 11480 TaxID=2777977 RepID=A0A928VMM9_9CYAN|nr:TetR/AcrR family transcriptional regulator [Romeriopsis navalis]MBE9029305.1 TetR/AcrR family transcriptional regulator [Romeriopsis navalis LEGE 11480]
MDKKQGKKSPESKLGRQHWINAGLMVLGEGGVEAVRVEPLAKRMKMTKGSFYWHFKNRNDLLEAILAEWIEIDTNVIIEQVNQIDADPKTKLLYLLELAYADSDQMPGLSDGRIENAIRAWAKSDPKVAEQIAHIDEQRLNYTKSLFLKIGFSETEAMVRARLAYYALIGELTIGVVPNQADRLAEIHMQHAILTCNIDG